VNREALTRGGREEFLARVRKGLGHAAGVSPPPSEPPPERDESVLRQVRPGDAGMLQRWVTKATENTMKVLRAGADGVLAAIDGVLSEHKVGKVIANARELDGRFGLSTHLASRGVSVLSWGVPGCRDEAFHCDAAVTDCRAGLADTGAVLVWSDAGFGRSSTLVVPVHVVLLPASRVMADLIDGLELVMKETGGKLPSNVVVINGPSKTADIEMNLVTGVHGPKYVYVVLIEGM
jgi:L-lactate utilization protein LutC